jgi:alkylhydroperoxidase/carboxymuconolactone decarboxylase family protein YurZ
VTADPDAWVELPSEEELRAQLPPDYPYDFGVVPPMARLMRAHPEIAKVYAPLFAQIMFGPSELSRREREMIAAVAASAQDCYY